MQWYNFRPLNLHMAAANNFVVFSLPETNYLQDWARNTCTLNMYFPSETERPKLFEIFTTHL